MGALNHQPRDHQEGGEGPARSIRAEVFASTATTYATLAELPLLVIDPKGKGR